MGHSLVLSWPDALMLAALTAGVWTLLAASAERLVSEARPRPRRSGPSRPNPSPRNPFRGLRRAP